MAGRVERRINDKFYFVVDEVGGSSDCESELASDIDVKPRNTLTQIEHVSNGNEIYGTKDEPNLNDLGDKNSEINLINLISLDQSISRCNNTSDKDGQNKEKKEGSSVIINKDKLQRSKKNVDIEESSTFIDMDVDCDLELTEPKKEPLLRITFRDEDIEKRMKSSFSKFISQKFEDCIIIRNSENSLELEVYDNNIEKLHETDLLDFNLDTTPGDNHVNIPNYGKMHDLVLSDKCLEEKEDSGKLQAAATSCFNCMGNHNLRDCPKVKDFKVINKNRLKFQNKKQKLPKTSRYHLDSNQKYSHLVPGALSKKLRNALNLRRDQQPGFIYRMRLLGYPPAWLEEARVSHSGVAMYDDTGAPVLEEDEEEGEILPEGAKDKFDLTKIIEFPGFNVPLPSNFKDESKYYQCPALSEDQSKENLIKLLEPKTVQAYVKSSLSRQKSKFKSLLQNDLKREASSPTIEEMEEKKRQLLMELNSEDSTLESKVTPNICQISVTNEPSASRNLGAVKNLELGTPILKSVSPFSKLPSREQFSCNVSDVINFKNLPNSTGKYETMREVIEKIRISASKGPKE